MRTQKVTFQGPAGTLEGILDLPDAERFAQPLGTAVISHPHPQFGGTMINKVVHTLARAFLDEGWRAVRYNYRGVGRSAGSYDEGRGETQDLLAVVAQAAAAGEPLALAGFSFGTFVTVQALAELSAAPAVSHVVLAGTSAKRLAAWTIPEPLRARSFLVHGERDDIAPLAAALDWARPQALPVTVVPGAGHFFDGHLPLLKSLVAHQLRP